MRRSATVGWLLTGALALTACAGPASPEQAAPTTTSSPTAPAQDEAVTLVSLPGASGGVAVGGGFVWVVPHRSRQLFRIDPVTSEVTSHPLPGSGPGAEIAADDEGVWLSQSDASFAPQRIVRVDPRTGGVVADLPLKAVFPKIGNGAVWAGSRTALYRISTESNTVTGTVRLPECLPPFVLAGHVWCATTDGLVKVDERTLEVTTSPVPGLPDLSRFPVAVAGDRLWLLTASRQQLVAVDGRTSSVAATVDLPDGVQELLGDAVALDGVLWLGARGEDDGAHLLGLDLETLSVRSVQPVQEPEFGMAAGFGSVWVPQLRAPLVQRFTPRT